MQATKPPARQLVRRCTVILDGLRQDQVAEDAIAARLEELGTIAAAYQAMRARTSASDEPASSLPRRHLPGPSAAAPRPSLRERLGHRDGHPAALAPKQISPAPHRARTESCVTPDSQNQRTPPVALPSKLKSKLKQPTRPTRTAQRTAAACPGFDGDAAGPPSDDYVDGLFGKIPRSLIKPPRRPRKPTRLDQLYGYISRAQAQLQQAPTEQERDFLKKKIRGLEGLALKEREARVARRRAARDRKARARWERMNGPR
jgi:hypothetical protein